MMQKVNIMNTMMTVFVSAAVSVSIVLCSLYFPEFTGGRNTPAGDGHGHREYSMTFLPTRQVTSCMEYSQKIPEGQSTGQPHQCQVGVQESNIHANFSVVF